MKLSVNGLCASTVDHRELFENVSFTCERGERIFILGPSGTGKSTLLRVLARLHEKTGGSVMLDGSSSSRFVPGSWRARVMYFPQATKNNLPGGPGELLDVAAKYRAQIRRNKARQNLLRDFLKKVGLDETFTEKHWRDMSGGEAQRAALCVALSLQPDFLLLDEPTSACDPESARKVERTLIESGIGLVWVTHNPEQYSTVGGGAVHLEPLESHEQRETSQIEAKQPDQVGSHDVENGLSGSLNRTAKTVATAVVSASLIENSHALRAVTDSEVDTEDVSWLALAEAGLMLIAVAITCSVFALGIEGKLVVAGVRSFVQLLLLGAILVPVFKINNPLLSFAYICMMLLVAVQEAMARPSYTFPRMLRCVYLSFGGSVGVCGFIGLFLALGVDLDARSQGEIRSCRALPRLWSEQVRGYQAFVEQLYPSWVDRATEPDEHCRYRRHSWHDDRTDSWWQPASNCRTLSNFCTIDERLHERHRIFCGDDPDCTRAFRRGSQVLGRNCEETQEHVFHNEGNRIVHPVACKSCKERCEFAVKEVERASSYTLHPGISAPPKDPSSAHELKELQRSGT
mmetsp:Transcript_29952/g.115011  ORF Transcript_29952/g.115011 Transcript_29952/m.115011 type:complete len:573 (-) Transcript_29952:232-1950(-)